MDSRCFRRTASVPRSRIVEEAQGNAGAVVADAVVEEVVAADDFERKIPAADFALSVASCLCVAVDRLRIQAADLGRSPATDLAVERRRIDSATFPGIQLAGLRD